MIPSKVWRNESCGAGAARLRSQSRALRELRASLSTIAGDAMTGGADAARDLLEMLDARYGHATAQELISLVVDVDRARNAARMARPPVRYDWRAWSDVSRRAADCLIAAVRTMRRKKDARGAQGPRIAVGRLGKFARVDFRD